MNGFADFKKAVTPLGKEDRVFETRDREALRYATAHESQAQAVIWRRGGFDDPLTAAIAYCKDKPMHVDYVMNAALSLGLDYPAKFDPSLITPEFKRQAEVIAEEFASIDDLVGEAIAMRGKPYKAESNIITQLGTGESDLVMSNTFHDHKFSTVWSTAFFGNGFEFASPMRAAIDPKYVRGVSRIEDEPLEVLTEMDIQRLNAGDVVLFHGSESPYAPKQIDTPFLHRGSWPVKGDTRLSAGTIYYGMDTKPA
jgi:hypothetical protein